MNNKILTVILGILLIISVSISVVVFLNGNARYNDISNEYELYKNDSENAILELEEKRSALDASVKLVQNELESKEHELENKQNELDELSIRLDDSDKYFEELILEKDNIIAELKEVNKALDKEIDKVREKSDVDIAALTSSINTLEDYIKNDSPLVRVELTEEEIEERRKEEEAKIKDEDKEKDEEIEVADHLWYEARSYISEGKKNLGSKYHSTMTLSEVLGSTRAEAPVIAVYYQNLATGFVYAYNGDLVFDAASVMKAPYITAVYDAAERYENGEIKPSDKDERYSKDALDEMFNFESTIVLDHETMDMDGSGVLKDAEDGEEYTFTELIKLSLEKSDNIAFKQIKKRFTNKWYYEFCKKHGVKSPLTYEMNLTVNEAGKLFEAIYYYTLRNKEYGAFIRDAMTGSAHSVISVSALAGNDVAHKYGWDEDAYNDAAIVYGDSPYVAIVFTNIDCGGKLADEYIKGIFKKIDAVHKTLS
jgi:hypothetical protein